MTNLEHMKESLRLSQAYSSDIERLEREGVSLAKWDMAYEAYVRARHELDKRFLCNFGEERQNGL